MLSLESVGKKEWLAARLEKDQNVFLQGWSSDMHIKSICTGAPNSLRIQFWVRRKYEILWKSTAQEYVKGEKREKESVYWIWESNYLKYPHQEKVRCKRLISQLSAASDVTSHVTSVAFSAWTCDLLKTAFRWLCCSWRAKALVLLPSCAHICSPVFSLWLTHRNSLNRKSADMKHVFSCPKCSLGSSVTTQIITNLFLADFNWVELKDTIRYLAV